MRQGTGRIYSRDLSKSTEKTTNRSRRNLGDITNTKLSYQKNSFQSNCLSSKNQKLADHISFQKQQNFSIVHNVEDSRFVDSLAQYENPTQRNNGIVKKLSSLNNIFKEIKILKQQRLSYQIRQQLSQVQDKLIGIQRNILKQGY